MKPITSYRGFCHSNRNIYLWVDVSNVCQYIGSMWVCFVIFKVAVPTPEPPSNKLPYPPFSGYFWELVQAQVTPAPHGHTAANVSLKSHTDIKHDLFQTKDPHLIPRWQWHTPAWLSCRWARMLTFDPCFWMRNHPMFIAALFCTLLCMLLWQVVAKALLQLHPASPHCAHRWRS